MEGLHWVLQRRCWFDGTETRAPVVRAVGPALGAGPAPEVGAVTAVATVPVVMAVMAFVMDVVTVAAPWRQYGRNNLAKVNH